MSSKKYDWNYIIEKIVIPSDKLSQTYYKSAMEYFCDFYKGHKGTKFSEDDARFITEEIIDEANHKIQLTRNQMDYEELQG